MDASIWSSVEPGIGLIAISLAALRPMFASMFAGFSTSRSSKHYGSRQNGSKHYGNSGNVQPAGNVQAPPRPSLNTTWKAGEENGIPLRGLPPPIGHFVLIEGGSGNQLPAKLQKRGPSTNSLSTKSRKSPKRSMSTRISEDGEAVGDKHTIIMTQDFKQYSGTELDLLVSLFSYCRWIFGIANFGRFLISIDDFDDDFDDDYNYGFDDGHDAGFDSCKSLLATKVDLGVLEIRVIDCVDGMVLRI